MTELQQRLGTPLKEDATPADGSDVVGLDALTMRLKESETTAAAAQHKSDDTNAEVERRAARRVKLTDLRTQANQQLTDVGKRPGNPFVPTAFGFTDPLRGGEQPRRLCRGVSGDRRVCG